MMDKDYDFEELAENADGTNRAMAGWYVFDRRQTDATLDTLTWNDRGNGPEPTAGGVCGPFRTEVDARGSVAPPGIRGEIATLLDMGVPLEQIVVNDGDDRWGQTCATTREAAQSLVDEWKRDGCDESASVGDLQTADEWLKDNPKGGA